MSNYIISLERKVALVTGGARGIGAECNRQLAKAGAKIVLNYYHSDIDRDAAVKLEQELLPMGTEVIKCEADISSEDEVRDMIENAIGRFGKIDILVNNAGVAIPSKFEEMSFDAWKKMTSVILDGTFLVTRYVIPHMIRQKSGNVIMISTNATINGGGGSASYPAAKAGMEGLAKQLVKEYASKGIRTNIIQPAVIDTDMLRGRYPTDEQMAEFGKAQPVGRVGTPEDIANAVVFLASDKSSYICGASLLVDGGRAYYK